MAKTDTVTGLKRCGKCREQKSPEDFHRARNTTDGRHGWCRVCMNAYMSSRRIRIRPVLPFGMKRCPACGEIKALDDFGRNMVKPDRARSYCRPCENAQNRIRQRVYVKTERYRLLESAQRKKDWKNGKTRARQFARLAVYFGLLVQRPCERCGAEEVQAHHEDYSKPLDVRWLCLVHHGEAHRKEKEPR